MYHGNHNSVSTNSEFPQSHLTSQMHQPQYNTNDSQDELISRLNAKIT